MIGETKEGNQLGIQGILYPRDFLSITVSNKKQWYKNGQSKRYKISTLAKATRPYP
jgi:hypothetical protein